MPRLLALLRRRPRRAIALVAGLALAAIGLLGAYHATKPLPPGLAVRGKPRPASDVRFLADLTWVDSDGKRHVEQVIFDEILRLVASAERYVLVDMFLFNSMQGPQPERTRALTLELTSALLDAKARRPDSTVILITDPINSVYGGHRAPHLAQLRAAGVRVVTTDLTRLRDSNPLYSAFWRAIVSPFGRTEGGVLPNPFTPDGSRVPVRAWLELMNFKANHRKVVVADDPEGPTAIVTSANPHDGSSAHGNVALRVRGPVVRDIVDSERAVAAFSGTDVPGLPPEAAARTAAVASAGAASDSAANSDFDGDSDSNLDSDAVRVALVTESGIQAAVLDALGRVQSGDRVDVAMFYLSDRDVIAGLKAAGRRGATVRLLLDPNKDAFGRTKNGVPNRPVAEELAEHAAVRWCDTHGEQCHAKLVLVRPASGEAVLIAGSANLTRRNLDDYNLETDLVVRGPADAPALRDSADYFERVWGNAEGRLYSTGFEAYRERWPSRAWKALLYRVMEATGMSTF